MSRLFKADPHKWGLGKTHLLDEDGLHTFCGKTVGNIPGRAIDNSFAEPDCKICLQAIETRKRQAEWEAKMLAEKAERERKDREFWRRYNEYLQSERWRKLRRLVFERAGWICEGCRKARCTQVHHLTYERVFNEMLFDLVAVCDDCHERIHPDRKELNGSVDLRRPSIEENQISVPTILAEIRLRLSDHHIPEPVFIDWLSDIGVISDGIASLDLVEAKWLRLILDNWEGIPEQVVEFMRIPKKNYHEQS